ncbi:helix-turn-helix domain-containing protein [candidate division WOR-3 bacterium]|nr:helix-turn-helix domain-containing protein [candidate division WOR-3 bacterium]
MANKQSLRLKVARHYLQDGMSFRQTALKYGIAYCTVFRWVKLFKEQGEERLLSTYKKPWNRASHDLEQRIVLMKEREPGLTVRQARAHLEKVGIKISIKGIWGIWKRHGYAGFTQENMNGNFTDCPWTREAKEKYDSAKRLFDQGVVDRSTEILNSVPALPENELLPLIPDSLLNIRRQIEKTGLLFGKIPVGSYLERLTSLHEKCYRQNLYYSALIVGLIEIKALSWGGKPLEMLNRTLELRRMLERSGSTHSYSLFAPRLSLMISEGFAHTGLLNMKEASDIARACRSILRRRKRVSPFFMRDLGQLYAQLEDFRETKYWYLKSISGLSGEEEKITKSFLADIFIVKGEYKRALEICKNEDLDHWGSHSKMLRIQSMWSLSKGMPHRAISLATEVLASLKKEEAKGSMFGCYYTIASAYCSLGEKTRARRTLKKIIPFLTKNRLEVVKAVVDILLAQGQMTIRSVAGGGESLPTIRLVLLLKNGQYIKAIEYAEKKGITGLLHRYVFFFPEAVTGLLQKGKPTGLPRAMLNLPVFRKEIPVYSIKFLGNLVVYKNQKYLRVHPVRRKAQVASSDKISPEGSRTLASRVRPRPSNGAKLAPKDTAFLIHLATAKSRHIALDRIYNNFWPDSKRPARNLAHLLVRLRKALCLPSHFLYVKGNRLCFDCHFITDYGEYLEHLGQAKAFLVAGEWEFARNEYLHAFSLFRDAPFRKMYDDWSEDIRTTVLTNLENEAAKFAEACAAHEDRATGVETLQKISKSIPCFAAGR